MSPSRRNFDMRISLPPRLMMTLTGSDSRSPLSSPCSSAPHTPMPYDMVTTPDCNSQQFQDAMYFDDRESVSSAGSKRGREDEDEELSWTEEDVDTMQATLLHPFRPLSTPYPPGELPPPNILDELTHQIVKYAYRPSPIKRSSRSKQPAKPHPHEDGWTHTWASTRRKLFRLALAESQSAHGLDSEERKLPRNERTGRPGIKRMDSMDFLDQEEEEEDQNAGAEDVGHAARLSTSLQNSARTTPLNFMSRSMSDDVVTTVSSSSSSSSSTTTITADLPSLPSAIVLTPASPATAAPPLRRRGSSRGLQQKTSRPSLLQRGRSFTASDLEADSSIIPDSPVAKTAVEARSTSSASGGLRAAASLMAPMTSIQPSTNPLSALTAGLDASPSSRLTRSQSNGDNLSAHAKQKSFIADRQPSTTEKSMLAMPFEAPTARVTTTTRAHISGGWSDSDDEGSTRLRHVKKIKPIRGQRPISAASSQPSFQAQLVPGPALRSPFEEKSGMSF